MPAVHKPREEQVSIELQPLTRHIGARLSKAEAAKMGMDLIVIPKANAKGLDKSNFGIEIRLANKVSDVYQTFFN